MPATLLIASPLVIVFVRVHARCRIKVGGDDP
jgi:hypothetical protein